MPKYLIQVAYSAEGWSKLVANPENRIDAVRPVVESLGGSMADGWISFGDYDLVAIIDMPDNASAAAFSLAASAGGAVKAFKTTPLLSAEEGLEAMRKAGQAGYKPPG